MTKTPVSWKVTGSRWYRCVLLAVALWASLAPAIAETPRQFADRFYRAHLRWDVRGAPDKREIQMMSAYFGTEPLRLFGAVEDQRHHSRLRIKRKYTGHPNPPLVKPIWSKEGDCLSSVYEGISTFAIGRPVVQGGRVVVPAYLEYGTTAWTDHLVLDRAGDSWVVADIRYTNGKSLVSTLKATLAQEETYLREPIQ